ncbi:MAG: hypothetical protein FJ090_01405 [Deltaproteobacteria bacterium]|nr:hypothetical protein [Deltaproteobacteria bacterium]
MRRARLLAFSLLVLALVVAAGEGVCRALWTEQQVAPLDPANVIFRDHPTLFWVQRPFLDEKMRPHGRLRTNSLGLRNEEVALPRPPGVYRILSLGESSTWGASVDLQDTYSKRFQQLLNQDRHVRGGPTYEVINAGVGAYSSWQSSVYLRESGLALDPQMVLVYHLKNDRLPRGVVDRHNYLYSVSSTDRRLYERRRLMAPALNVLYESRLYFALRRWGMLTFFRQSAQVPPGQSIPGLGARVPDEDRLAALSSMAEVCKARGVRMVVIKPVYGTAEPDELLAAFAADHQLPFIDLAAVKDSGAWGTNNTALFNDLVHPSADGHRLIARAIYAALDTQGILARMTPPGK